MYIGITSESSTAIADIQAAGALRVLWFIGAF
jgi:hypothetical protein